MNIVLMIFFFGVAMSLIVLKGIFMSGQFAVRSKRRRLARRRALTENPLED